MAAEEKINLVTLDGEALLTGISLYKEQLILDADLVSNISESSESALLYQIAQAVKEKKIQNLRKKNIPVLAWTIKDTKVIERIKKYADGLLFFYFLHRSF